ncbi:MAG: metal ABC transporter permease [Lachnospiraceae bacterium]
MSNIFATLQYYFQFPFVWYALIVGTLIALCSSLLGVTLVLKHYSYIGDGLSHVAFGAIAVALAAGFSNSMVLVLPITIVAAVLMLQVGNYTKINGDAIISMISVGSLAIGYLLMNLFSTSSNLSGDVCSTLFGSTSILTLTRGDVVLCIILSVLVIIYYIVFYNKIFAVTFDESFSRATGINTRLYDFMMAVIIAVIIVLAMNLVGSLLISALVVFPSLSAMRLFRTFRKVVIASAVISVSCGIVGILVSILASTPVGSTVVTADIIVFAVCQIMGTLRKR